MGTVRAFRSNDRAETMAAVARILAPHDMQVRGKGAVDAALRHVRLPSCHIADIRYGADVAIRSQVPGGRYLIHALIEGRSSAQIGGRTVPLEPGMIHMSAPGEAIRIDFGVTSRHLTVSIDQSAFGADGDMRSLARGSDPSLAEAARRWRALLLFALEWGEGGPDAMDGRVEDLVIAFVQSHFARSAPSQPARSGPLPWYVARALRIIEDAVAEGCDSLSVEAVAMRLGVAVRTLQVGFRRDLGMTFRQQLRETRLATLHVRLRDASPESDVTRLMQGCGISSFGRYAGYYRARFGCAPSSSLTHRR